MDRVLAEIQEERQRQRALAIGGNTDAYDEQNTVNDWVAYICAYAGRAAECVRNKREMQSFRENMVKVAALAVAAIESHDASLDVEMPKQVFLVCLGDAPMAFSLEDVGSDYTIEQWYRAYVKLGERMVFVEARDEQEAMEKAKEE